MKEKKLAKLEESGCWPYYRVSYISTAKQTVLTF